MSSAKPGAGWSRLLRNLGLFFALLLGVGLVAGLIGALGEDDLITGTHATIVYLPDPETDPSGVPTVVEQGEDIQPGRLILYPTLTLFYGTIFVLPVILIGLGAAEVLSRVGVSQRNLRFTAVIPTGLLCLLVLAGSPGGLLVMAAVALVAYTCLMRLPSAAPHSL